MTRLFILPHTLLAIYLSIVALFLAIFSFTILVIILRSLCKHEDKRSSQKHGQLRQLVKSSASSSSLSNLSSMAKKVKLVNYPTIASNLFYFLSACVFFPALSRFDVNDSNNFGNDKPFVVSISLFVFCLFSAKLCIYAQFLARLYYSFNTSYLAPSKCTIVTAISLLCVLLICLIWWIIVINLRYSWLNYPYKSYETQLYMVFAALFIFDCCLSWFVVALFTQKLCNSVLLRSRATFFNQTQRLLTGYSDQDEFGDGDGDDGQIERTPTRMEQSKSLMQDIAFNSIDRTDEKRLNLITKQLILSSTSILTTQLAYIAILILLGIRDKEYYDDRVQTDLYVVFAGVLYPMEVVLNCIALWFSYSFASRYYDRCCKFCHEWCKLCVIRRTATNIQNKYLRMSDYEANL